MSDPTASTQLARRDPRFPPDDVVERFEQCVLNSGCASVTRAQLWAWWNETDAGWAGTGTARARLASALDGLQACGSVELPACGSRLWDGAHPSLPERVGVPLNRRERAQLLDAASEPWAPAMNWAGNWIRSTRPRQYLRLAAVQINHWLLSTIGRPPPLVAREERSLHIFEDEKQLARLSNSALFQHNRLTLDDLLCDAPLGSLHLARLADEGPALVLENKSTFDSVWRAQKAASTATYAAIIFGGGDAASALAADLAALEQLVGVRVTRFDYAGDVDIAGIEAAAAFAEAGRDHGLTVRMAVALWEAVAAARPTGEDLTGERSRRRTAAITAHALDLPRSVVERLVSGQRVPQERIDRTKLADTSWWTP